LLFGKKLELVAKGSKNEAKFQQEQAERTITSHTLQSSHDTPNLLYFLLVRAPNHPQPTTIKLALGRQNVFGVSVKTAIRFAGRVSVS
jgi:hypothetical protein